MTKISCFADGIVTTTAYIARMKRIARNRKNLIADVFARGVDARSFSLDGYFKPEPVSMEWVRREFDTFDFAKLTQRDDGVYEVHVTGRQWYEFTVPARTCCERTHYPGETCATFEEARCKAGHAIYLAHCEFCTLLQMELSGELSPVSISEFGA